MACWAMGRLLGPQLMVPGAGTRPTSGSACTTPARRAAGCPCPIFQALEDFTVYLILIAIERRARPLARRDAAASGYPPGIVLGTAMVLWGIERSLDEHLWLGEDGGLGSDLVQMAGVLLVVGGVVILVRTRARWREWLRAHTHPASTSRRVLVPGPPTNDRTNCRTDNPPDQRA